MDYSNSCVFNHLANLVSFDTQNPPRKITADSEIFSYLKANLEGFEFEIIDAGDGCLSLLATRGQPELLFNFHIDTVPIANGWTIEPLTLTQHGDKLVGLGACDIKGAAACMLSAVNQVKADVALLFSSDEEHGSSQAVKKFLSVNSSFKNVVVAEPTKAKAVVAHRGIQTATAKFTGISGHASEARALKDSAIHKAGSWIHRATQWVADQQLQVENLVGLPFNIGTINGGIKANMIADQCELKFGFRPLPGQCSKTVIASLSVLSCDDALGECFDIRPEVEQGFFGPCLPAANQDFVQSMQLAKDLAKSLGIEVGDAVSFWTEASLFSEAGMTALVYGPGDIAQAHTADEWVAISQLQAVESTYLKILAP
jgi:acetylornithine deacetylase